VTDGRSGPISLTLSDGTRHSGTVIARPGMPWQIWRISLTFDEFKLVRSRLPAYVSDAQGVLPGSTARLEPAVGAQPLTVGVPLFTYRTSHSIVTIRAFVDGDSLGLGRVAGGSPVVPGRGKYFGSVKVIRDGLDAPWAYGFLSPRMARVIVRLANGRTVPAKIIKLGRYRVFAVQLIDERPGDRGQHDMILTYDAAGRPLATWRA
jgi:hypothetical protein